MLFWFKVNFKSEFKDMKIDLNEELIKRISRLT